MKHGESLRSFFSTGCVIMKFMQSMIIQKHILRDLSNPRSNHNHTEASQSTKLIIIIRNAYKNPVVLSRTHEDIERMIALLELTQSSSYL